MSSTITVDSLLNSYPSLKRIANKDRVRKLNFIKKEIEF